MKLSEIAKTSAETKRKEQQFGLANNAFGAAAGALGTKAVYDQTREKYYKPQADAAKLRRQQKASDKAAGRFAAGKHPFTPLQRARAKVGAITSKVPKKYVAPAALGAAVGSQVLNAGADAQSAAYFARELATTPKSSVKKDQMTTIQSQMEIAPGRRGSGYGRRITEEPVSKAMRRFDSEADRQHRLGIYEGLGATGAIGAATGGGVLLNRQGVKMGNVKRKLGKHKLPLALIGAAGASGATSVAARRAYLRDRNEAWS